MVPGPVENERDQKPRRRPSHRGAESSTKERSPPGSIDAWMRLDPPLSHVNIETPCHHTAPQHCVGHSDIGLQRWFDNTAE
jgi:hypothetical protein